MSLSCFLPETILLPACWSFSRVFFFSATFCVSSKPVINETGLKGPMIYGEGFSLYYLPRVISSYICSRTREKISSVLSNSTLPLQLCSLATLQFCATLQRCNLAAFKLKVLQLCNLATLHCNLTTLQPCNFVAFQTCKSANHATFKPKIAMLQLWKDPWFMALQLCNLASLHLCNFATW